jgi:hypothetical protein
MTNLDIDRRLALAIGYRPEDVQVRPGERVFVRYEKGLWIQFKHQDTSTIYPIAERYRMMPQWAEGNSMWLVRSHGGTIWTHHADPRTCIALAVIEAAERVLLK